MTGAGIAGAERETLARQLVALRAQAVAMVAMYDAMLSSMGVTTPGAPGLRPNPLAPPGDRDRPRKEFKPRFYEDEPPKAAKEAREAETPEKEATATEPATEEVAP